MPTFCRHNRFIERCPICTPPPAAGVRERGGRGNGSQATSASPGRTSASSTTGRRRPRGEGLRVRREDRAEDDGYSSELLPGVRASADAGRLAEEIAFSSGRLLALAVSPPHLYAEARELGSGGDIEQATWICFLIAYLRPLEGDDPFAGIRAALTSDRATLNDVEEIPLGARSAHEPGRGAQTLDAYRNWIRQAGSQQLAFTGDPAWSAERRFERVFERLALPGFARMARFELLVTLGRLGSYELRADSLHLSVARMQGAEDPATAAAKRMFAIGDALHLERRSAALADAVGVPIETLDVALANWGAAERSTLGFPPDTRDEDALQRTRDVLGL